MKSLNSRALIIFTFILLIGSALSGCSTVPPPRVITTEERMKLNDSLGQQLASSLEPQIKIQRDPTVENYLTRIAERITQGHTELKLAPVTIRIVKDRNQLWNDHSLPGNRLYLSGGSLRQIAFENELAALISLELAHLQNQHLAKKLEAQKLKTPENPDSPVVFFGESGVLNHSEKETLEAIDAAVGLMYRAGYDPRGLVSIWRNFQKNGKNSPHESRSIVKFLNQTRQSIAAYSPLRNPVISSEEFLKIKKRLQRL